MADNTEEGKEQAKARSLDEVLKAKQKEVEAAKELGIEQEKLNDLISETYELNNKIIQQKIDSGKASAEEIKFGLAMKKSNEENLQLLKEQNKLIQKQRDLQKDVLNKIANMGKAQKGFLDEIAESGVAAGDLAKALGQAVKNIPGAVIRKGFSMVKAETKLTAITVDMARANYTKLTGSMQASIDDIQALREANMSLTPTYDEMFEIQGSLYTSMSSFSTATKENRDAMTSAALSAKRLGIDIGTAGAAMDIFTSQMGMSGTQTKKVMEDMQRSAMAMKVPPGKLMQDFVATAPKLAMYGKLVEEVFMGLSRQAKSLGVEMNSLISYTEQFDTFEGAAKAAGSLNAALGGNFLDSMRLMTAETKEQQIEMVRNAVLMSGKSFDAMSRHEKMYIAAAAGITDYSMAVKMFSESARAQQKTLESGLVSQEDMVEVQNKAAAAMEKIRAVGQSMAVALAPMLDGLHWLANWVASFPTGLLQLIGGLFLIMGVGLTLLTTGFAILNIIKASTIATNSIEIGQNTIKLQQLALELAATDAQAASQLLANSAKLSAIGANQGLIASMTAAAPVFLQFGTALLYAGFGALMFGAGIALAAVGVYLVVKGIIELGKFLLTNLELLPPLAIATAGFALSLYGLAGAFITLTLSALPFLAVFGLLAFALTVNAPAIVGAFALLAAGGFLANIVLASMAESIAEISESITSLSDSLSTLGDTGGIQKFIKVVTDIEDADISKLKEVMDQADRYVTIQTQVANQKLAESVADGINKLTNLVFGTSEDKKKESKQQQVIKLEVDGTAFGKVVYDSLKNNPNVQLISR